MTFDAQCDLAAVVYGPDDDPDRLLTEFARDLNLSGRRAVGVIQVGRSCRSQNPGLGVVMVPSGDVAALTDELPAGGAGCGLDAGRMAEVADRVAAAIPQGSDLVIINCFGRMEAEGAGLSALITSALDADIPVLIAVSERRFATWIKFSAGMNVRLACRRDALDRWWRSVTGAQARRPASGTFCEIAK